MEYFISGLLGWVASLLQSDLTVDMNRKTKFMIAVGACLFVSLVVNTITVYQGGVVTLNQIMASFGTAFATSQTFYVTYFKARIEENIK
jgi:CHASE2 domain-containing sensor protein